jgi:putative FmdB family regulatory protein
VPIYDYVCGTCGRVTEVVHGFDDAGPAECPECGGPMTKAFAAPVIHFKGSGWAKKDRKSTSGPVRSKDAAKDAGASTEAPAPAADSAGGSGGSPTGGDAATGGSDGG